MSVVADRPERSVTDVLWQLVVRPEPGNTALDENMHARWERGGIVK